MLAEHVTRVRDRIGSVAMRTGGAMALVVVIAWLAIETPLDLVYVLPTWGRAIFLAVALAAAGVLLWWFGIRRVLNKPGEDRVALAIERAVPEFRTRFIASVQLARHTDGSSRSLIRALIKDTSEFSREVSFDGVVKTVVLRRWSWGVALAVVAAAGLCVLGGHATVPLLQRALLIDVPVPRNTQIVAFTGDRIVALGDDIRIEANAGGVVPSAGELRITTAKGIARRFTLDADPLNAAHFYRTLQSVQEAFQYTVALGDNESAVARVTVRPRPTILGLEFEQQWPPYTKEPPQRRASGELRLLAGSKLAVKVKPSANLRDAQILLTTGDGKKPAKVVPMQAAPPVPGQITEWNGVASIPAEGVTGITFQLVDGVGVVSKGMATYRIEIVPDQPPSVRVLWPERREELVTSRATLLVSFEAKDDFGVARVRLHYGINWNEGLPIRTIDLDLGGRQPRSLTRRFEWKLDHIKPPLREGDVVDYWFEAQDTNDVTGPGLFVIPEHYQARVVSEADKRADLANRLNDTLQGLKEVKTGQEDLATRLGELIREISARP